MLTQPASRPSLLFLATAALVAFTAPPAAARGIGTPFCFGDLSSGACPCANTGQSGRGCDNSFGTGGAWLVAAGAADLANSLDGVSLAVSGLPPNSLGIFIQSDALLSSPLGMGDGLRCAGGNMIRFGVSSSGPFGSVSYPGPSGLDPVVHLAVQVPAHLPPGDLSMGPGATRYYNYWYRNPQVFCTVDPFNVSNSVPITW